MAIRPDTAAAIPDLRGTTGICYHHYLPARELQRDGLTNSAMVASMVAENDIHGHDLVDGNVFPHSARSSTLQFILLQITYREPTLLKKGKAKYNPKLLRCKLGRFESAHWYVTYILHQQYCDREIPPVYECLPPDIRFPCMSS